MTMTFGSLFDGIGAFSLGLRRAGMKQLWSVEIDRDCRRVTAARFPGVPQYEDINHCGKENLERVDVVVGGSPCQGFSVAGKGGGLADGRSGLFSQMARVVDEIAPRWVIWENVPGCFSENGGEDFAAVLAAFSRYEPEVPKGGWLNSGVCIGRKRACAWGVLDCQHFGLAQRRKRVFVVCRSGDSGGLDLTQPGRESGRLRGLPWRVLLVGAGMPRDTPPRREAGSGVARTTAAGAGGAGGQRSGERSGDGGGIPLNGETAYCLPASSRGTGDGHGQGWNSTYVGVSHDVAPALQEREGKGQDSSCTRVLVDEDARAVEPQAYTEDGVGHQTYKPTDVACPVRSGSTGDSYANLAVTAVGGDIAHSLASEGADASDGCSVAGCDRKRHAGGLCSSHYNRFKRHGDPLAGRTAEGVPLAFFLAHVEHTGDECVMWPHAVLATGYGSVEYAGKTVRVHRLMCEKSHGEPASPDLDAAHSCGNRLCINPRHLRWATRAENMADAVEHGTTTRGERHGGHRLKEEDVKDILARLKVGETHESIAELYGVGRNTITDIAKGKNWSWLSSQDGTGRGTPVVAVAFNWQGGGTQTTLGFDPESDTTGTLSVGQTPAVACTVHSANSCAKERHAFETERAKSLDTTGGFASGQGGTVVAFVQNQRDEVRDLGDLAGALAAEPGMKQQTYVAVSDVAAPLTAGVSASPGALSVGQTPAVAFGIGSDAVDRSGEGAGGTPGERSGLNIVEGIQPTLRARPTNSVASGMTVRRLTPTECERLQGLPDGWTAIQGASDSARYRQLGNAGGVPCLVYIGLGIVGAEHGWLSDADFLAIREMSCRGRDPLAIAAVCDFIEERTGVRPAW